MRDRRTILAALALLALPSMGWAKASSPQARVLQRQKALSEQRYQQVCRVALDKNFHGQGLGLCEQITGRAVFLTMADELAVRHERQAQENKRWTKAVSEAPNALARWLKKTFTRPENKIGLYDFESLWGRSGYYSLFDELKVPAMKQAVRALEAAGLFELRTIHFNGDNRNVTVREWTCGA
ncbi:MAG: hypothetical protein IT371_14650 [Deltaproteobacteria bacterium]|nr:hypothetical protein [Deltaproteobacteria bacterium]